MAEICEQINVCCSSVDATRTFLSSVVLGSCSVGPQMTDEANLHSEESLTVGTRYCGELVVLFFLACLLPFAASILLASHALAPL